MRQTGSFRRSEPPTASCRSKSCTNPIRNAHLHGFSLPTLTTKTPFLEVLQEAPNDYDKRMAVHEERTDLGGDIMIHGGHSSIGCLAMGDLAAEELFVLAAETGVDNISVILSPVDFRTKEFEGDFSSMPSWIPDLYDQIKAVLMKYPKRTDGTN